MKKLLFAMFAFALCLGMNSCIKENKEAAEKAVEEVVEKAPALADIVAKAKAEGANWSVDEWKEQFKQVMLAIKPMMVEMSDLVKNMKDDPSKMAEMVKESENIQKKYADLNKLMEEFSEIAEATENGKVVIDDEEWGKKMMEELGIPDPDEVE